MKNAKPIMVQGTMSGAGKSLMCAALCRIFKQDGYSVAPFKSQNMALNSYVTDEGLEMGRAQVVQAETAGISPSVLMNPILLKPTTDVGSQVIVNGEVRGNMRAADYFKYKKQLIPDILDAYGTLASRHDIIVIEGAGSPAEINLKTTDIVNMGMAKMASSPVLLVGDIDRGGVFAQLYGTLELLERDERELVKATVINKFRGDVSILQSGLDMLYDLVKIPCAGVVPYTRADIDDEDSLSERLSSGAVKPVDIAVIRLPRISNFTDFSPFERQEEASLRYVSGPSQLGSPDLIILPGTKSTMSDLKWLRESGLEGMIMKAASSGVLVFGVCGGYQMLGRTISDPLGVEGDKGSTIKGMELLPVDTVFEGEKTRKQVSVAISGLDGELSALNGLVCEGYEIHMGTSGLHGAVINKGNVYGTYIHGVFDGEGIADAVMSCLCGKKGIERGSSAILSARDYKESQYDLLADVVRNALDMDLIYGILNGGI